MHLADRRQKQRVIEIISKAYRNNPSILWILKQDHKFEKRITLLADYCCELGFANDGVFITEDNNGVCILYDLQNKKGGWKVFWYQLRLALFGVTLPRVNSILYRQKMVNKLRSTDKGLYCLMYAVDPDSPSFSTAIEIQREVYLMADERNTTLYAETTVPKNKRIYEKYGFVTYHQWQSPKKEKLITYFLRRDPGKNRIPGHTV